MRDKMIYLPDLPNLTDAECEELIRLADRENDFLPRERFGEYYFDSIADFKPGIIVPDEISDRLRPHFQNVFKCRVKFGMLKFSPAIVPGHFPIHRDNGRNVGINYILKTGGDSVVTRTFNNSERDTRYWHEHEVSLANEHIISKRKWHVLDVNSPHSVNNLTSDRIMLYALLLSAHPKEYEEVVSMLNINMNVYP